MMVKALEEEMVELASEVAAEAVYYFSKAAEASGLVLTSELRNSFEYFIQQQSGQMAVSANIHFKSYGRLKDMQKISWRHLPSVDELEDYVYKVGLDNFAWVNRFGSRKIPTTASDARHIAWAIAMKKKKVGDVRRRKKFYNRTKMDFINVMRHRLVDSAGPLLLEAMKDQLERKKS